MSDTQSKVIVGAAVVVGVTVTAASLAYLYSKKVEEPIPTKWIRVGELIDINFFPVKSCAPIKRHSIDCNELGLMDENFVDRSFIVSNAANKQVTGRAYPKMVLIQPKIKSNQLTLTAPGQPDLILDMDNIRNGNRKKVACWYSTVKAIDAGDEAAQWISEYVVGKKESLRLYYYPYTYPTKGRAASDRKKYAALTDLDAGTYHDSTSYMLINQGSIDELNSHLDHVVTPLQFRPNFVVKGPNAFAEDKWRWIRIGNEVIFRHVKPCTRCIFTNINPESGERHSKGEPLETMVKNRSILPDSPPVMGIHMGTRTTGRVTIGDPIYINYESDED